MKRASNDTLAGHSKFADNFILKGGILLAALDARRPTRDIDFAARAIENTTEKVLSAVRTIAAQRDWNPVEGMWIQVSAGRGGFGFLAVNIRFWARRPAHRPRPVTQLA
jgi:hypothetical protein